MGANVSQLESVNLKDLPADVYESIVSQTYTVQRNPKNSTDLMPGERGAVEDEGWKILREPTGRSRWAAAHATFLRDSHGILWRFHMTNGRELDDPEFLCGWRKLYSFWPTHMKTWEEREAWNAQLKVHVETLKTPLQKQEEEQAEKPMTEERKARIAAAQEQTRLAFQDDLEKNT